MPTYTGIIQDQGGAVHDLRAYGAAGNGTTDDTTAIRNAIAAVPEGGTLFIPNGKFRITDTISINRAISIRGSGPGSAFWLDLNSTTKTGIVIGLVNPVTGGVVSVAENQSYRDFGVFGPSGSCKYGLALYHCARSRFENIHVRPGSLEHAIVIGGCLYCHFNFVCSNNSTDGYPTGSGLWSGAAILVQDLRAVSGSGSDMPTNICVFDCTLHGGTGGGLAFKPQAQGGGNNIITGTYEGFPNSTGTVYGSGYGLLIDGCAGFDLRDAHVEATAHGTWIKNSGPFSIQDTGFFSGNNTVEKVNIESCASFSIRRVLAGSLRIGPECSVYEVTSFTGQKDLYAQPRKQDSFFVAGSDPSFGGIAESAGMATFATENLVPNGDLSRTPHGFTYIGVVPTLVRTGEGLTDPTRRFNRYGLKVSGGAASGFSTRATLVINVQEPLQYVGQPVTIWADIKRTSGAELGFGVYESTPGRVRNLALVHQSETEWVRVAATYYPNTTDGAWAIFITPLTDAAYEYHLGGVGALVGVAAPMGVQSPAPSFQNGLQLTGKRMEYASAAPTTGTWQPGDIVYNAAPSAGGTVGWVCTTAGTPGTWKTFGAIAA